MQYNQFSSLRSKAESQPGIQGLVFIVRGSGMQGSIVIAACMYAIALVAGCAQSTRGPLVSSLSDMAYETRAHSSPLLRYNEILSLAGTLPMPDVGLVYYSPQDLTPTASVGVSYSGKSFILSMETVEADQDHAQIVADIKMKIEEVQNFSERIALAAYSIASASSQTPEQILRDREDVINRLLDEQQQAIVELRKLTAKPGVLVARWKLAATDNTSATVGAAGQSASATIGRDSTSDGYIILSGVRIRLLFVGGDLARALEDVTTDEGRFIGPATQLAGVTTYALQTKAVAYTNRKASRVFAKVKADLAPGNDPADSLEQVRLQLLIAIQRSEEFGTGGVVGDVVWSQTPLNPLDSNESFDAVLAHDAIFKSLCAPGNNWKTVLSQVANPSQVADWIRENPSIVKGR